VLHGMRGWLVIGILSAQALFLAVAGLAKLRQPAGTSIALRGARLPAALASRTAVRLFALLEVAAGGAVLTVGGRAAAAVFSATFAALAVVSARMVRTSAGRDCGCVGTASAPISHWHTGVNVACALTGALAVAAAPPGLAAELTRQPLAGIPLSGGVVLLAWLCFLTVTALPALLDVRARLEETR
jgi:hypothetical protein